MRCRALGELKREAASLPEDSNPHGAGAAGAVRGRLAVGSADAPTEVEAARIRAARASELSAEGNASLRRSGVELKADSISYRELTDEAVAEGNVELRQGSDVMRGPA